MTPTIQRIGILVIAFVMIAGTLGSFIAMVLANQNQTSEQEKLARDYQEQMEKRQEEARDLSSEYYNTFKQYESRPAPFDASQVGEVVTYEDLNEGSGEEITEGFKNYRAYYLGWNPSGTLFDGSISGSELKAPLDLSQMNLIPGWYEGVKGMKIGGVREITIPSDLAYGESGSGEDIPPNTPIKFLIMAIPPAE